jgi:hypothetical protein
MLDYNVLGQVIDTTWGRSSTPATAGHSVKFSMHGDTLTASYAAIVNFGTEKEMVMMKRNYEEESKAVIKATIDNIKANYKNLSGKNISLKEMGTSDSIEIIGYGVHNPKRTAYYRRKTVYELS